MEIFPTNYLAEYLINGYTFKYSNFFEVAQGGPEVGTLSVNDEIVGTRIFFGGPPVFYEDNLFVPILKKGLLGRRFKICLINLKDRTIKEIGYELDLILLKNVDEKTVFFYADSPNAKISSINWK
jgi:hypothetical protein